MTVTGYVHFFFFLVFVRMGLVFRSGISDWHGEGVAIFTSFFWFL